MKGPGDLWTVDFKGWWNEDRHARPVVVLPSGARSEGLDVAAIAELLRRLG